MSVTAVQRELEYEIVYHTTWGNTITRETVLTSWSYGFESSFEK